MQRYAARRDETYLDLPGIRVFANASEERWMNRGNFEEKRDHLDFAMRIRPAAGHSQEEADTAYSSNLGGVPWLC